LRKAVTLLLLLLLAAGMLLSGDVLAAAFQRNLGHLLLLDGAGPCDEGFSSPAIEHLERAVRLQANGRSDWRSLLRVKGWSDRQWIRDALGESPPAWVDPDALRRAAETLRPSSWAMEQPWTEERCRAAWDAWTLGLVWALYGRWSESVAAYQAGLGLAPGRVPAEIVQEYYLALARYTLSAPDLLAEESLAAAKYLALAGEEAEAAGQFQEVLGSAVPYSAQACQAERWLRWEGDGSLPPGPGACRSDGTGPDWRPGWVLPSESTVAGQAVPAVDQASGRELLGFDLDSDVLEAGAEALGSLYWREPDGQVSLEDFRQPNLWPNSGTSWLPLEDFTTCLPGYVEPAWVLPCAGTQVYPAGAVGTEGSADPVGRIRVAAAEGPDTFIVTAGVPVTRDVVMVYGGRWRMAGDFPKAHMARYGGADQYTAPDRRAYYEVVVDLADLHRVAGFSCLASLVPALPWDQEFMGWMRPRTEVGDGDFEFDDVFGFALPAAAPRSP